MKNIFFNSSMPRSMSTLMQCILNQHPEIQATQTDPVLEYLYGARMNYTNTSEVKAMDKVLAANTWKGFCQGGLNGYAEAYTTKPNLCIKTRGGTIHYRWFEEFMPYKPKMICMVRNLKSIFASMEKLYRKNQSHHQPIQNHAEMKGTSTAKRIDAWVAGPPVGLALERLNQCFLEGINQEVLYIRAEDLTSYPQKEMDKIYQYLGIAPCKHDFDNVEQTIKEDDSVYGLTSDLHTIRQKVQPLTPDYNTVLGKQVCDWIDNNFAWYQQGFGYTK
jgi:sulfotransferase